MHGYAMRTQARCTPSPYRYDPRHFKWPRGSAGEAVCCVSSHSRQVPLVRLPASCGMPRAAGLPAPRCACVQGVCSGHCHDRGRPAWACRLGQSSCLTTSGDAQGVGWARMLCTGRAPVCSASCARGVTARDGQNGDPKSAVWIECPPPCMGVTGLLDLVADLPNTYTLSLGRGGY